MQLPLCARVTQSVACKAPCINLPRSVVTHRVGTFEESVRLLLWHVVDADLSVHVILDNSFLAFTLKVVQPPVMQGIARATPQLAFIFAKESERPLPQHHREYYSSHRDCPLYIGRRALEERSHWQNDCRQTGFPSGQQVVSERSSDAAPSTYVGTSVAQPPILPFS